MVSSNSVKMLAPLTPIHFRHALGQFATGVTVVTVEREHGLIHGMTANSFASVSLDPLLILVCVDHRAKLLPLIQEKKRFGVSVLKEHQQALSEYFAQAEHAPESEERLGIRYRWTPDGIPLLDDTLVQLGCTLACLHDGGDHAIVIGQVETAEISAGEPLLFFRGQYRQITPAP